MTQPDPTAEIPVIRPLVAGSVRPVWSVMIPVCNRTSFLRQTLETVLPQAPGPDKMQIAIVDNSTHPIDWPSLLTEKERDRIEILVQSEHLPLALNWNRCIDLSRGHLVHLLHDDDWLLDGFYRNLEPIFDDPTILAAHARHLYADSAGHWTQVSPLESPVPGALPEMASKLAVWQEIQCPATVVRRSTYERLGGYRPDLQYIPDWEMWCRIAASGAWGFHPTPAAVYRVHEQSASQVMIASGRSLAEWIKGGEVVRENFSPAVQRDTRGAHLQRIVELSTTLVLRAFSASDCATASRILKETRAQFIACGRLPQWCLLRGRVAFKEIRG